MNRVKTRKRVARKMRGNMGTDGRKAYAKKKVESYKKILPCSVLQTVENQQPPIPQPPAAFTGAAPSLTSGLPMDERETLIRTLSAISRVTTLSVRPVMVP